MTHRPNLRPCDHPHSTRWLIERGQQENHTPTVWYVGSSDHPEDAMYGGRWTESANRAVWFLTREECETAIFNEFARYKNDRRVHCHASEHVFLSQEPNGAELSGALTNGWNDDVEPDHGARSIYRAAYRAGLRDGREKAARVCDGVGRPDLRMDGSTFYTATGMCAAAIRAMEDGK